MKIDPEDPRRLLRKLPPSTPLLDRVLLRSAEDERGCWIFDGALDSNGYGMVRQQGQNYRAHVVTTSFLTTIPAGMVVDHKCRVRSCCNPDHLEIVTNSVNTRDRAKHKSNGLPINDFCRRGHTRTPESTYVRPDGKGTNCLPCIRLRTAASGRKS